MKTIPQNRRALARSIASQLENDQYLVDELHSEMSARSMVPLASPCLPDEEEVAEDYLAENNKLAVLDDDPHGIRGIMDDLNALIEPQSYDESGTIGEIIWDIRSEQCPDDEDPDERDFTISPKQLEEIGADMAEKLEAIKLKLGKLPEE